MRSLRLTLTALIGLGGAALGHASTTRASSRTSSTHELKPEGRKHHAKPAPHPVELVSINTHETYELVPGVDGSFGKKTMKGLARFLRCHHTQKIHAMSERLARLLYTTSSHFDWQRIEVVAGYRAPRIALEKGNPKSPHKKGLACDFRVPGVTNETLRDYVRTYPKVGVGYYPNSGFVHLDVRDKLSAFWVDYSGPGERAQYSPTPEEDIKHPIPKFDPGDEDGEITGEPRPGRVERSEGREPQVTDEPGGAPPDLPRLPTTTPQNDE